MMRAIPSEVGTLDIARLDTGHLPVTVMRGVLRDPLSVVPLSDESAPVLDVQVDPSVADFQRRLLIAVCRSCQHVHAVIVARRQINRLPLRNDSIGYAGLRRGELESHIVERNLYRQYLRRQSVALSVESTPRL